MELFRETLLWILDGKAPIGQWEEQKKETQKRIAFVHSLGQKCDCVGWSNLDLGCDGSAEIMDKIERFCRENDWRARGWYTRDYTPAAPEWHCLRKRNFKVYEETSWEEIVSREDKSSIKLPQIKACSILESTPRWSLNYYCVPERFRTAWQNTKLDYIRFCWLRDIGKYQSEQYFAIAPLNRIHRTGERSFSYKANSFEELKLLPEYKQIRELGGWLPRLAEFFYDLHIFLPLCCLQADMPADGIGYTFYPWTLSQIGQSEVVLRADLADSLIKARGLSLAALEPVIVSETPAPGFIYRETKTLPFPDEESLTQRMIACRALQEKGRPVKELTEKDVLRLLRRQKREHPEAYDKALPKQQREALPGTKFAPLEPYYAICSHGHLSDEYELLSLNEVKAETARFQEEMQSEELAEGGFPGIVIAICPDGDHVILSPTGTVLRISHEEPTIFCQWKSLPLFIADSIEG